MSSEPPLLFVIAGGSELVEEPCAELVRFERRELDGVSIGHQGRFVVENDAEHGH